MSQPPSAPTQPATVSTPEPRSSGPNPVPSSGDAAEIRLPGFVIRRPEGVFVDLALLQQNPDAFGDFVTETFAADAYFPGLDYRLFQAILFDPERVAKLRANLAAAGRRPEVRLADSVARFPASRKSLCRGVKTGAKFCDATYFLEPMVLEKTVTSVAADGTPVSRTVSEPARLSFDEFVAYLWNGGVRYGLLEQEVRERLADETPKVGWVTVARQLDPNPGKDAEIREEFDKLHRDRSPAVRADGSVNLRHFKNTFPQVAKNVRLVRKIPRVFGSPGRNVGGFPIDPPQPQDIDLEKLAGGRVRCEHQGGVEYLVSSLAGFLNIDPKSNQFFITEGLINREGISVRTTGSLDIEAEVFEEHGDVEKGFSVTGNSVRVRGSVFGAVFSKGGTVQIGGNVSGGEIRNADGPVEVAGFASHAHIEAHQGEVRLQRAENSVIRARSAILGELRNCTVVAGHIEIGKLQNCLIAGTEVSVGTAAIKPGVSERDENVVVLEVPDLAEFERGLAEKARAIAGTAQALAERRGEITKKRTRYGEIMGLPAMQAYLDHSRKAKEMRDGGRSPSPEQARLLLLERNGLLHELTEVSELSSAVKALDAEVLPLEQDLAALQRARTELEATLEQLSGSVSVRVETVAGATVVRKRKVAAETQRVRDIQNVAALRKELDSLGSEADRVFQGESGTVQWIFEPRRPVTD